MLFWEPFIVQNIVSITLVKELAKQLLWGQSKPYKAHLRYYSSRVISLIETSVI